MSTSTEQLFETCEAVGRCLRPSHIAAGFHHFYWDSDRDTERMDEIFERGKGHDDPMSEYGAVKCKTCGLTALVKNNSEDFPEL